MIEQLFTSGKTFTLFPVKVFYMLPEHLLDFPVKLGVGAGIKHFRKAVERNGIKRLLREAYRTEKLILHSYLSGSNKQVIFFLLYIDKTLPSYTMIKIKMPDILQKLIKELNENNPSNT